MRGFLEVLVAAGWGPVTGLRVADESCNSAPRALSEIHGPSYSRLHGGDERGGTKATKKLRSLFGLGAVGRRGPVLRFDLAVDLGAFLDGQPAAAQRALD